MDFHLKQPSLPLPLPLPLFSSEPTKPSKEMMQGVSGGYFSMGQWQELEVQALIYRHMLTGSPVPPQLLHLLLNSNSSSHFYPLSNFPPLCQTAGGGGGGGYWGRGGMDPEPGRCRRTDGKKWRCSRDVVAGHKYCERHVHRGRNRSRKPVEVPTPTTATATATATTTMTSTYTPQAYHCDQRLMEKDAYMKSHGDGEVSKRSGGGRILRPFFNDWSQTVEEQEMVATSLSISVPGDDFSLTLSTGNDGARGEREGEGERGSLNWGMQYQYHGGSMGGPLAEALRSSSTSHSSSPTSVLHQLQRGSTSTSYVTT